MKINPIAGPSIVNPGAAKAVVDDAARRAKAIALISGQQAPATDVAPSTAPEGGIEASSPSLTDSSISTESVDSSSEQGLKHLSEGDVKPPSPTSEVTKEEPLSTQYAVLARKEKALRAKAQELKAKEESFRVAEAANKAKESVQSELSLKDQLAKDPWKVLNELGLTYDKLTELSINQPRPEEMARDSEMSALRNELKALKDAQEKTEKSFQDQQTNSYKQAVNQIRTEVKQLVLSDPTFETIKETNSVEDVVELIEKTYSTEGVLLTVEEASQAIEDYLVEEAIKIAKLRKIQERLKPQAAVAPTAKAETKSQKPLEQPQTMKTLTNGTASSRQLTTRERAILAFKGQLND